jgi:predicted fused transcriptional regulator/phosphomethylpyrimidine kinase
MAKQWEAQMKSVMQQILGTSDPSDLATTQTAQTPWAQAAARSQRPATTQGKTDGWGIQRSFERDLGGTQNNPVVRPVGASEAADEAGAAAAPDYRNEKYTGRTLIKAPTQVRDPATLMNISWKDTQRGEKALLRNLGWTQPMWDAKSEPGARWPQSMRTPFSRLGATQREAVRQLGLTSDDWDKFVESVS